MMTKSETNPAMPAYLQSAANSFAKGDIEGCFQILEAARRQTPDNIKIVNNLGVFAAQAGRIEAALDFFEDALRLDTGNYEAWFNKGLLLRDKARLQEARTALESAVACRPSSAVAVTALAFVCIDLKETDEALKLLTRATELEPASPDRWSNLGNLRTELRDFAGARAALDRALELSPGNIQSCYNLAILKYKLGEVEAASAIFDAMIIENAHEDVFPALEKHYFPHIADDACDGARLRGMGEAISAQIPRSSQPLFVPRKRGRKLRIGFLSADFRRHSCAYFLKPLFENWNRDRYEFHCFADFTENSSDEISTWFAAISTSWKNTTDLEIDDIAAAVAEHDIDVLFELGGYTSGSLISVCRSKPAPAIVAWLGFPGSTGVPEIGYRLGDAIADPPTDDEAHFSEKIIRLGGPFLCYQPPPDSPAVASAPIKIVGAPTFGSFNSPHKIRPPVAAAWARIVTAFSDAKLLIKAPLTAEPNAGPRLRKIFANAGLPADRLVLIDVNATTTDHLCSYARIDVALDTFPYNGTTTTCESLWMGVPVVTFLGDRHSARVGASLLRHAGLDELVATDLDGYVEIAVSLGRSPNRIDAYRQELRSRIAASPLMDGSSWTRSFENAVERIYADATKGTISAAALVAGPERTILDVEEILALAEAAFKRGHIEECFSILRAARSRLPDSIDIINGLGTFSMLANRTKDAIFFFRLSTTIDPRNFEAWFHLGTLLRGPETLDEAHSALERAISLRPDSGVALTSLASVAIARSDMGGARILLRRAVELEPGLPERWSNLGHFFSEMREFNAAISALEKALTLAPNHDQIRLMLATLMYRVGDVERSIEHYKILEGSKDVNLSAFVSKKRCFLNLSELAIDGRQLKEAGALVSAKLTRPRQRHLLENPRAAKLRVGFLSADFRRHSCAYFLMPLFENWDRTRFEFHCFAEFDKEARPDAVSQWFAARATSWLETEKLSAPQIADAIAASNIDILLELGGYTGMSLIDVTAHKPAPAIVAWLGFPASTGIPEIGYRIGDAIVDPPELAEEQFSERIERIDGPFICFSSPPNAPEVAPPPMSISGYPTFGSFNSAHKIRPHVAAAWTRIVNAIPTAKLMIKTALLEQPKSGPRLRKMFTEAGLASDKLILIDTYADTRDHLGAYARIDVALDTFPYNGTTTTCEALWMGVPVVTFAGNRHSARVGASLLLHAGMREFVAADIEGYVALAVQLATNPMLLKGYRYALRGRLAASPLMDGPAWTRGFETVIEKIYADAKSAVLK